FPPSVTGDGGTTFHHVRINPAQGISLSANINLTGDSTNMRKFTPAGGSVTFNGSGAQRIAGSVPTTFGDPSIAHVGAADGLGQGYGASELNGNAGGTLRLWRFAGSGPWTAYPTSALDTTDNWVESNAVSNLSCWAISQFFPVSHRLYLPLIRR